MKFTQNFNDLKGIPPLLEAAGSTYIGEPNHTDGNLISGHAWPDLPGLTKEFVRQVNL